MIVLFLIFWGLSILFCIVTVPICSPTNSIWGFPLFHILFQHLLVFVFSIIVTVTGVRWYVIVVSTCVSLTIRDVGHLFICLLAICVSVLEKYLFRSSAHFLIRFCCCCWVEWLLYIFGILTSYWICDSQISSPFSGLPFHFAGFLHCAEAF